MHHLIIRRIDTKHIEGALEAETLDGFTTPSGCELVPVPDGKTATAWMREHFDDQPIWPGAVGRMIRSARDHEYHDGSAPVDCHAPDVTERLWTLTRQLRDRYLKASDGTQMPDVPGPKRAAWATYRQALRDLPASAADPRAVVWPEPPA